MPLPRVLRRARDGESMRGGAEKKKKKMHEHKQQPFEMTKKRRTIRHIISSLMTESFKRTCVALVYSHCNYLSGVTEIKKNLIKQNKKPYVNLKHFQEAMTV